MAGRDKLTRLEFVGSDFSVVRGNSHEAAPRLDGVVFSIGTCLCPNLVARAPTEPPAAVLQLTGKPPAVQSLMQLYSAFDRMHVAVSWPSIPPGRRLEASSSLRCNLGETYKPTLVLERDKSATLTKPGKV